GDICQFSNGDKFVVEMEEWLEVSISWIDEPECEDQIRDLYRISKATIIGNIELWVRQGKVYQIGGVYE
ncbi:unnamed protein product, partial [marine sediment metagenome]